MPSFSAISDMYCAKKKNIKWWAIRQWKSLFYQQKVSNGLLLGPLGKIWLLILLEGVTNSRKPGEKGAKTQMIAMKFSVLLIDPEKNAIPIDSFHREKCFGGLGPQCWHITIKGNFEVFAQHLDSIIFDWNSVYGGVILACTFSWEFRQKKMIHFSATLKLSPYCG